MSNFDRRLPENAFLRSGTLSFADCCDLVARNHELKPIRRRDLRSSLHRVAKALGRTLETVPAEPAWLRPRISVIVPAAIGLTPKSWSNALSDLRAAFACCGVTARPYLPYSDLSPLWNSHWRSIRQSGNLSLGPALGRFIRFLDNLGISPSEVSNQHTESFRQALALSEIRKLPHNCRDQAIQAWNRAGCFIDGWPPQKLDRPKRGNRYGLNRAELPDSFNRAVEAYVASMERPDPLDPSALHAPLRPATVRHRQSQVYRLAAALVNSGFPITNLHDLSVLADPANADSSFRWLLKRNADQKSPGIADLAVTLKTIARRHLGKTGPELTAIAKLCQQLEVRAPKGMTSKNAERLRPLRDPANLSRLLHLPDQLIERATRLGSSYKAALLSENALAIALLLQCPIRRLNVTELRIDKNLHSIGDGRLFLRFEADEVKNSRAIEFELTPHLVAQIRAHLALRSPLLCPVDTPWLFPRRDGSKNMEASCLSTRIVARILAETGIVMNMHLFRHLAAKIWLEAWPGHYEEVRRLLGHVALSTTLSAYSGNEAAP